tara:strand:- start:2024 stop:2731 length:708 start_codon:yes stop_codon:yes gene_type:complete
MAENYNKKGTPMFFLKDIANFLTGGAITKAERRDRANRAKLEESEADFDRRLKAYEKSEFQPLDAEALEQENIFEDLEVDTEAADYAREQFQQQQANIMAGLRGAAGASGISGLAQSLSMQAKDQAKQTQLTIGQQLQQNRRMQMQEQARLNAQERQIQLANMEGARQFELDKMSTLMGVSGQKIAGAQQAIAQRQQMYGQIAGAVGNIAGAVIGGIGYNPAADKGERFSFGGNK